MRPAPAPAALAAGLLTLSGLAMVVSAPPATSDVIPSTDVVACTSGGPRPCIASFTRNGGSATGYAVQAQAYEISGSKEVSLSVTESDGGELGAASTDVFSVTVEMGTTVPRVVTGKGRQVDVVRDRTTSGAHRVTVTGRPVVVSGQCDQSSYPWRCPAHDVVVNDPADFNNREFLGVLDAQITDYGAWDDVDQRDDLYGLDYFTNVAATSVPPSIRFDSATDAYFLEIDVANRRFRESGALVSGRSELRIPNAFLRSAYGVPNPELMTGSSLTVTGAGTTTTTSITQDAASDAMVVLLDGLTFPDIGVPDGELRTRAAAPSSMRTLRVKRGVVTPTRVSLTKAARVGARTGRLTFVAARARGARVNGYQARCSAGRSVVVTRGGAPRIVVRGLKAGRRYSCQVRATSKAGPGRWSVAKPLRARP